MHYICKTLLNYCKLLLSKPQGYLKLLIAGLLINLHKPDKQKKVKKYNLFFNPEIVLFEVTIS
ncbi:hypothetical protein J2W55_002634 [Mucilaginibacter pocheonensis]|uniref:Uncharacterized protein n=1 Tax=Mucilaginibacter pocheonensis TaxID=398050 RepID=A0ABU1TBL3_9SPHI|nr:hypothetical protein [Mucilaginibacter pocheonensis]